LKKALIHYFSGTGNSLLAAKKLSKELAKYDYEITFHSIENGVYEKNVIYSLHIFLFPVYATAIPHIVLKYIQKLPKGNNTNTAVISTNGRISCNFRDGYQGWTLLQSRLYLYLKNYNVFFTDTLDFPQNITAFIPPRKPKFNIKIILQAFQRIPLIAEKIAKVQKYHRPFFLLNIIWSIPFGILYSLIGRRFIGKMFVANSLCNLCKQCIEKCPVRAIQLYNRKIRWNWNCEGCMRCINTCPQQAIQTSLIRIIIFAVPCVFPFIINEFCSLEFLKQPRNYSYIIFKPMLYLLSFIFYVLLFDWFIFKISNIPILKNILSWGYTKFFRRYCAEQFEEQFLSRK
jgi:ferredoxin